MPEATDPQVQTLLNHLFQTPEETINLLAPTGWQNSPYICYMHPTVEQIYAERLRMYEAHKDGKLFKRERPVLEEIIKEHEEEPIKPVYEFLSLFGDCCWKIFSDNHKVYDDRGIEYDLGSFRGTGSTLADFINDKQWTQEKLDYMDFYCAMGLHDYLPYEHIYGLIFTRLKEVGCDWRYEHPRMQLISFDKEEDNTSPENYDPSENLLKEMEKEKHEEEIEKMQTGFDEIAEEEKQQAINKWPKTVMAYHTVYSKLPDGFIN